MTTRTSGKKKAPPKKRTTIASGDGDAPKKKAAPKKRAASKKKTAAKRSPGNGSGAPGKDTAPAPKKKARPKKKATTRRKRSAAVDATDAAPAPVPRTRSQKRRKWTVSPRVRRWAIRGCIAGVVAVLLFLAVSVGWVALYRSVDPPGTFLMVQRYYSVPSNERQLSWAWRDLGDISPHFAVAVLAAEDQRFPDHSGFDTVELQNAIAAWQEGERLRGASTLSQQTAKNLFLYPTRSFLRKGMEVWFTMLVEAMWPKRRILEMYLNIAEMGNGIYGAEAASQHYFGKPARDLTVDESARLASILPSPLKRSPLNPSEPVAKKQAWIRQQMHNLGGPRFLDRLQ